MSRNARNHMGRALRAAPSFSLDFTKGVLDPRLTFTRASGGTFVGPDGLMALAGSNVPRFDFDPSMPGVGAELVSNGGFTTDTSGWVPVNGPTLSAAGGVLNVISGASGGRAEQVGVPTVAGRVYYVTCLASASAGDTAALQVFDATGNLMHVQVGATSSATMTRLSAYFVANGTSSIKARSSVGGGTSFFDGISVREVIVSPRGLLIEEARTNLGPTSRSWFDGAGTTVAQNAVGSDGAANTAFTIAEGVATSQHFVANGGTPSYTSGTTYTLTVLVKPGTATKCQITGTAAGFGTTQCANFNLVGAGAVLQVLGGVTAAIKPGPNGFYACSITLAASASAAGTPAAVSFINTDTDARLQGFPGTGRTLILDHAQAEVGAFPTSIIPTSGAAATRAGELCQQIANGMLPWFNPKEGTTWVEYVSHAPAGVSTRAFTIRNGSSANLLNCANSGGNAIVNQKSTNSVVSSVTTRAAYTPNTLFRVAASYDSSMMYAASNGAVAGTGGFTTTAQFSGAELPHMLDIGAHGGGNNLNGWVRGFQFIPVALSLRELQRVTSAAAQPVPTSITPDFSLHFLDGVLDSRVTFTRASGGTRINSAGVMVTETTNAPRFDYDPVTLACKGLLVEEARTNLCTTSAVTAASTGTTAATNAVNMFGVVNAAVTLTETAASSTHSCLAGGLVSWVSGTQYACTMFVSPGTADRVQMLFTTGSAISTLNDYANFSLVGAGTVLATGSSSSASIRRVAGSAVYACTVLLTAGGTNIAIGPIASFINSDSATRGPSYLGSGKTLVVHGSQVEAGAFATSYIPTTGAAATRALDQVSVTGVNFSSWYRQDEGTIVCEADHTWATGYFNFMYSLDDGTGSNRIYSPSSTAGIRGFNVDAGGVSMSALSVNFAGVNGVPHKAAGAYKLNSFALAINGTAATPDTVGTLPVTLTTLRFGVSVSLSAASTLNGHIRHFDYYRQALPADFITELSK